MLNHAGIPRFGVLKRIVRTEDISGTVTMAEVRIGDDLAARRPPAAQPGFTISTMIELLEEWEGMKVERAYTMLDCSDDHARALVAQQQILKGEDPDDIPF